MSNDIRTAALAELDAAKARRRIRESTAAQEADLRETARGALEKCEAKVAALTERRGELIAAMRADDALKTGDQLLRARIEVEIAATQLATREAAHATALGNLGEAERAVRSAAHAVCRAERAEKAERFMAAMDAAEKLGRALQFFTGPDADLPADIQAALARVPKRDDINTPVSELRGWKS